MSKLPFVRVDGFITAVYLDGQVPDELPVRGRADDITYDAQFVRLERSATVEDVRPYNRRYKNTSIISANVGDYCDIQINRANGDINVYVHTERDDMRDCDGNPVEDL